MLLRWKIFLAYRQVADILVLVFSSIQGRNDSRWRPGQEASLAPAPMFETELFRKQMFCIEESTCDVVGTFRRPGNRAPLVQLAQQPTLDHWAVITLLGDKAFCLSCRTTVYCAKLPGQYLVNAKYELNFYFLALACLNSLVLFS